MLVTVTSLFPKKFVVRALVGIIVAVAGISVANSTILVGAPLELINLIWIKFLDHPGKLIYTENTLLPDRYSIRIAGVIVFVASPYTTAL